ncbi:hypothetical protein BDR04DRAFT_1144321 [Suillus decipiens]|nr:hypothetical protein BDR04DRAFT_1144321 [Suillus decipiens]
MSFMRPNFKLHLSIKKSSGNSLIDNLNESPKWRCQGAGVADGVVGASWCGKRRGTRGISETCGEMMDDVDEATSRALMRIMDDKATLRSSLRIAYHVLPVTVVIRKSQTRSSKYDLTQLYRKPVNKRVAYTKTSHCMFKPDQNWFWNSASPRTMDQTNGPVPPIPRTLNQTVGRRTLLACHVTHYPIFLSTIESLRREHILFYNKLQPSYEFTDISPHEVAYSGKRCLMTALLCQGAWRPSRLLRYAGLGNLRNTEVECSEVRDDDSSTVNPRDYWFKLRHAKFELDPGYPLLRQPKLRMTDGDKYGSRDYQIISTQRSP